MATSASPSTRPIISFLSLAHDPLTHTSLGHAALVKEASDAIAHGKRLRSLAEALAHLGWQVDIYTHQWGDRAVSQSPSCKKPTVDWIAPHCRIIRLALHPSQAIAQQVGQVAQAIQSFQIKAGLLNPLFHSFDDLSARVGEYFKRKKNWRWIHTRASSFSESTREAASELTASAADQVIEFWPQSTPPEASLADEVGQARYQRQWEAIATDLNVLYRQHLAVYVGASGLEIPTVCYLPLQEHDTTPKPAAVSASWYSAVHSA